MPKAPAANVKKNYENKESWTPGAGTPPEPTDTPSEAAQAQATDQPTNQEHPRRPQSQEANRGQAAATRSERESPTDTGTRDTASANQPKTRDHPNTRTTAAAEGNGAPAEGDTATTKQRYEKPRHTQHHPTPKKAAPTPKKAAPTAKKKHPQKAQRQHKRSPRPTDREPHRTPPIFEIARPPRHNMNAKTYNRAGAAGGIAARWAGRLVEVVCWKSDQTFRRTDPLVVCRQPTHFHGMVVKEVCATGPGMRARRCAPPVGFNLFFEPSVTNYWILLCSDVGLPQWKQPTFFSN